MNRSVPGLSRWFLLLVSVCALADEPSAIDFQWGVKIPLHDDVKLNATLYRPKDQSEPLPVVVTLTPYVSSSYHDRGVYFAQNDYVFVIVDVRGRGNSEGTFDPNMQEAKDGVDVIEWLATQPWSNGQVAMWGGSYAGYNQWAVAKEFPEGLETIVPAAAAYPGVDFPGFKNIPYTYEIRWQTLVTGKTVNSMIFGDESFWNARYQDWFRSGSAYEDLDDVVGNRSEIFDRWVSHPMFDEYWASMSATDDEIANMDLPILSITGQYDGDQPGAMEHYKRHIQHSKPRAREKHYLIMGPWDHAGTRTPQTEFGGLTVDEASQLDLNALHKSWYDWTMKDGVKPEFLKDQVAYYVIGEEAWRYAPSFEAITSDYRDFRLDASGSAGSVFGDGRLNETTSASGSSRYVYDPGDLSYANQTTPEDEWLVNQATMLAIEGDGLVFHTAPLKEPMTLAGSPQLEVWMAVDARDIDFSAQLWEIKPDGTALFLSYDMLRARHRNGRDQSDLLSPGDVERYVFDTFTVFAKRIDAGSRLRLVLTSPNTIYLQKNYGTGGVVAKETIADARPIEVMLYHDDDRSSTLKLPIAAASSVQ